VYTLIVAALFPPTEVFGAIPLQGLLMVCMYLFSIVISLFAAWVLGRTVVKGKSIPLILELPPYRVPRLLTTLRMMWERSLLFLKEAGTVILVCTIVLWALLSFPRAGTDATASVDLPAAATTTTIQSSYGGRLGKAIEPAIEP